jgi:hypothetical protein
MSLAGELRHGSQKERHAAFGHAELGKIAG